MTGKRTGVKRGPVRKAPAKVTKPKAEPVQEAVTGPEGDEVPELNTSLDVQHYVDRKGNAALSPDELARLAMEGDEETIRSLAGLPAADEDEPPLPLQGVGSLASNPDTLVEQLRAAASGLGYDLTPKGAAVQREEDVPTVYQALSVPGAGQVPAAVQPGPTVQQSRVLGQHEWMNEVKKVNEGGNVHYEWAGERWAHCQAIKVNRGAPGYVLSK